MAQNIRGKTALITGGAKRIGRAIALVLANAGVNIVIHYRSSQDEAEQLAESIRRMDVKAWTVQADFVDLVQTETLMERAWQVSGGIDILINNASMFPKSKIDTFTFDELCMSIKVDAWAPLVLSRHFAGRAQSGHIVNFLDTKLVGYDWAHVAYIAGKNMLELFTKMLAMHLAPNIAVNAIAPGLILPPEGKDQSYLEALKNEAPMRKTGNPVYIADAVLYLVTSEYTTGQVIFVDGGQHLEEGRLG